MAVIQIVSDVLHRGPARPTLYTPQSPYSSSVLAIAIASQSLSPLEWLVTDLWGLLIAVLPSRSSVGVTPTVLAEIQTDNAPQSLPHTGISTRPISPITKCALNPPHTRYSSLRPQDPGPILLGLLTPGDPS